MTALAVPSPVADITSSWRFLATVATIPPTAWGAIVPRGRIHPSAVERMGEALGHPAGPRRPHESVVGARLLQALAAGAVACSGSARIHAATETLLGEVEEWCEVGWPGRWAAPRPSASVDRSMVFAGGALAAAHLAEAHPSPASLRGSLALASTLLAEAAVGA